MYNFHKDRKYYFDFIKKTTVNFIIPFIESHREIKQSDKIFEIGCAEGPTLQAFTDRGNRAVGVELSTDRVKRGNVYLEKEISEGKALLISKDIYDIDIAKDLDHKFDLILLKDVIEHIFDQARFFERLSDFLNPDGHVFFGFPPWQMPFGGHQQVCQSKVLSKLPYFHLLPKSIYRLILKAFREKPHKVKELLEIKETGLSIERFERLCANADFKIVAKTHYLINPVYQYKFGLKVRKQFGFIRRLPWIRNFFTTGVYYLIQKN